MAIVKKLWIIITFGVLMLTPFSVGAIQLQTVGDPTTWSTAHIEFNGSHLYYAGEFELILGQGSDAFDTVGYCVELDEPISIPGLYDAELKSVDFKDNGLDAAWLMNEYAYGLGNGPADATIDETMNAKAALQLAIWETIHGADFTLLSETADSIENLYTGYLNGLATAKSAGTYNTDFADNFSIAHQVDVQDLLIYNPDGSGAVPEPSTILLMGCGLLFLGLIRKKRSANHS
jgi:hypothetical protein